MQFSIVSLNIGKISKLEAGKKIVDSAFGKNAVDKAELTSTGFLGDEQADLKHHGGVDKAVCVYSLHHLSYFESDLGIKMPIPSFGENFSIDEADEKDLFVGDIFESGEVKLQISQPRQPCFKTGAFHKNNSVIKKMIDTGATGFYFRVLNAGSVSNGSVFTRVESDSRYSLKYANDIMYRRINSEEKLKDFISYESLSKAWKDELGARLNK